MLGVAASGAAETGKWKAGNLFCPLQGPKGTFSPKSPTKHYRPLKARFRRAFNLHKPRPDHASSASMLATPLTARRAA